jgi:hypothetical protein
MIFFGIYDIELVIYLHRENLIEMKFTFHVCILLDYIFFNRCIGLFFLSLKKRFEYL